MTELLHPLFDHLWQSTLFIALAALLTFALRKNRASIRHSIWLLASIKFLIPFSLLVGMGNELASRFTPPPKTPHFKIVIVERHADSKNPAFVSPLEIQPPARPNLAALLGATWFCGFSGVLCFWWIRWKRLNTIARAAMPIEGGREVELTQTLLGKSIELRSTQNLLEPGVFGIFRPMLLLPAAISDHLSDAQLNDSRSRTLPRTAPRQPASGHSHVCRSHLLVSSFGLVDGFEACRRTRALVR
jgi:bla regulator protein blaR1